jgi:hypothetical protein
MQTHSFFYVCHGRTYEFNEFTDLLNKALEEEHYSRAVTRAILPFYGLTDLLSIQLVCQTGEPT